MICPATVSNTLRPEQLFCSPFCSGADPWRTGKQKHLPRVAGKAWDACLPSPRLQLASLPIVFAFICPSSWPWGHSGCNNCCPRGCHSFTLGVPGTAVWSLLISRDVLFNGRAVALWLSQILADLKPSFMACRLLWCWQALLRLLNLPGFWHSYCLQLVILDLQVYGLCQMTRWLCMRNCKRGVRHCSPSRKNDWI